MKYQIQLVKGTTIIDVEEFSSWAEVVTDLQDYSGLMESGRYTIEIVNVTDDQEV